MRQRTWIGAAIARLLYEVRLSLQRRHVESVVPKADVISYAPNPLQSKQSSTVWEIRSAPAHSSACSLVAAIVHTSYCRIAFACCRALLR